MSRIKLLLDVVSDMRSLADSIQAVCDAMMSDEPTDAGVDKTETAEQPAEPPKKASKAKTTKEPEITLEKVRGVLADKSRDGHTAEVRAIIQKYGADRLSDIDPKNYAAVLADAEVL